VWKFTSTCTLEVSSVIEVCESILLHQGKEMMPCVRGRRCGRGRGTASGRCKEQRPDLEDVEVVVHSIKYMDAFRMNLISSHAGSYVIWASAECIGS
jgi:hypothetical protein